MRRSPDPSPHPLPDPLPDPLRGGAALARSEVRRLRVPGLEHVRHVRDGQEWVPHWHAEWSFGAVVHGRCRCTVGGRPWLIEPGDVMAIAPGVVHTGVLDDPAARGGVLVVMLYVPGRWLQGEGLAEPGASGLLRAPALARQAGAMASADDAQAWLRRAVPRFGGTPAAEDLAADAGARPSPAERALLERVRAAVLAGEHRVTGLADRCGVSRKRIHQVVAQWTGMAPSDYLRAARLHRAKDLLARREPPAAVAADCGFADQAHFTRWFRRAFGYTPGDWVQASLRP